MVACEDNSGFFGQIEPIQFIEQLSNLCVHVCHRGVICSECLLLLEFAHVIFCGVGLELGRLGHIVEIAFGNDGQVHRLMRIRRKVWPWRHQRHVWPNESDAEEEGPVLQFLHQADRVLRSHSVRVDEVVAISFDLNKIDTLGRDAWAEILFIAGSILFRTLNVYGLIP